MKKDNILVYRDLQLPPSETFIRAQFESLRGFVPHYAGSRRDAGLPLPAARQVILNTGGVAGLARESLFKYFGVSRRFDDDITGLRPVLIHACFATDAALALPLARLHDLPMVMTFHGFDATVRDDLARRSFYSHRLYVRRRSELRREVKLFIAVSDHIRSKVLALGFPPDRVVVHYIGIDTEQFRPDPGVAREPIVLYVGRLVEFKGCDHLIRAMARVQASAPDAELVVVGDGPLRPALERQAAASLRRYRFLGTRPPEAIRGLMNRSRVFCVPSHTASTGQTEGFGMVFIEAQAMGLPVVSYASGGVPEAVAHGETGLLAPERDCDALARNILTVLQDDALREQFSRAGMRRVEARFNLRRQTQLLEGLYRGVLDS